MDGCQHTNTHAQQAQYTQPLPCLVCEQLGPHVLDVGARADGEEHDGQKRPEVKERTHLGGVTPASRPQLLRLHHQAQLSSDTLNVSDVFMLYLFYSVGNQKQLL